MAQNKPNIVHIGLGKCGTTTLQTYVFPEIARLTGYQYNPEAALYLSYKLLLGGALPNAERKFREEIRGGGVFVSNEDLCSPQPHLHVEMAERNLHIWGRDTTILITLRDPIEYQTSLYVGAVQGGLYRGPAQFFLDKAGFETVRDHCDRWVLDYFSLDDFDLRKLVEAYRSRFERVVVLPYETQFDLKILSRVFGLAETDRKKLADRVQASPRLNRSVARWELQAHSLYASLSGQNGTNAIRHIVEARMSAFLQDDDRPFPTRVNAPPAKTLSTRRFWPLLRRILRRMMPVTGYSLPRDCYENETLTKANRAFLADVVADAQKGGSDTFQR